MVIKTMTTDRMKYVVHFSFRTTNNAIEYKVLLARICLARTLREIRVNFHTDSRLVANQVKGEFVSKYDSMVAYVVKTRKALETLEEWELIQIDRSRGQYESRRPSHTRNRTLSENRKLGTSRALSPSNNEKNGEGIDVWEIASTGHDWRFPITRFIEDEKLSRNPKEIRKFRNKAV